MKLDRAEILRYMRMGGKTPEPALTQRIDALEREVLKLARPKYVAKLFPIGELPFESKDLRRCLGEAKRFYLFAATLGHEIDRLIRKTAALSAADLLIVQAVAATAIEQYIDDVEPTLEGPRTRRYSPGYGDLPLSVQREFLSLLEAEKSLGITLTETNLMIPSKSVTAIIGVMS